MTMITEAVKTLLEKGDDMKRAERKKALAALSDEEKKAYYAEDKKRSFAPEKYIEGSLKEFQSPSGRYRLELRQYSQGEGYWSYSEGSVFKGDQLIGVVQRNYGSFPTEWVEGHPNGHDYLVCGEDYQGQTVIELDTGNRRDYLPEEAEDGFGFCWADAKWVPEHQVLLVDGCIWACPYEHHLYDFSDPLEGWPQLKPMVDGEEDFITVCGAKDPTFEGDLVTFYETKDDLDVEDGYNLEGEALAAIEWDVIKEVPDDEDDKCLVIAKKTYRREGSILNFVSEWVHPLEEAYRVRQKAAQERLAAEIAEYKANDPLYKAYVRCVADPVFSPADYQSQGWVHDRWCPDYEGTKERRWCRRIAEAGNDDDDEHKGYTIDFELAERGPIKLTIYKDGKKVEDKFWMDHSVESVEAAFAYAKALVQESG
jgi:hypothetical protein